MIRRAPRDPFGSIKALTPGAVRDRLGGRATARRLLKGDAGEWPSSPPVPSSTSASLDAATEEAAADLAAEAYRRTNRRGIR